MALPDNLPLGESYGAMELGNLFSTMLFGVVAAQCYTYYRASFKDGWVLRMLVIFVIAVETLHTAATWANLYYLTIIKFGDVAAIRTGHWSLRLSIALSTATACSVEFFFAMRVYQFSKRLLYTLLACTLVLYQLAAGVATAVLFDFQGFAEKYAWLTASGACVASAVNIGNTIMLCYWLSKAKTEINVKRSQQMLDRLIIWAIETGLIITVFETVILILVLAVPSNGVRTFFLSIIAKLYSNSFYACLNGRLSLRKSNNDSDTSTPLTIISSMRFTRKQLRKVEDIESIAEDGNNVNESTSSKEPSSLDVPFFYRQSFFKMFITTAKPKFMTLGTS